MSGEQSEYDPWNKQARRDQRLTCWKCRIGIIHIDEVDKLARRGGSGEGASWGGRDVGGEGVQQGNSDYRCA
jgi:ATP-dependent protease HslVU (ClpYQ) ATPase subunit